MEQCPACGAENDESAAFCRRCGKQREVTAAEAPKVSQTQPPEQEPQPPRETAPTAAQRQPGPLDAPLPPQPPPYPPTGMPRNMPGFGYRQVGVPEGPQVYAGFWVRFVAFAIDALIVALVFSWPLRFTGTNPGLVLGAAGVLYFGAFFTYFILMTGHFGQTLGKMALRLKVVRQDMTPVDYHVAAVREFSMILSAIICYIGFIMAGFDVKKRALHDMIAKTYVLRF
jgi:uncharacterized RDD family membrane protein YckC